MPMVFVNPYNVVISQQTVNILFFRRGVGGKLSGLENWVSMLVTLPQFFHVFRFFDLNGFRASVSLLGYPGIPRRKKTALRPF